MTFGGRRSLTRLAVLAALLALVAGGCGGSDDGDGADASAANGGDGSSGVERAASEGGPATTAEQASGPEAEIRALYAELVENVYAGDMRAACAALTESARRRLSGGGSCPAAMRSRLDPKTLSKNRPSIVGLEVRGSKAVAQAKTKNSNKYAVPFVREDGEWKIDGGF